MSGKNEDFGRLEDAMLYQVLPRVRRSDLKEDEPRSGKRTKKTAPAKERSTCSSPALPHFPMLDSVASIRIAAHPPTAKFRVRCTNESASFLAADDIVEYTSEPFLTTCPPNPIDSQLDAMLAAIDDDRPSTTPSGSAPYAFIREGVQPSRGIASSSLFFVALIAIAVITMSIVALAVLVPHGDWALIQG